MNTASPADRSEAFSSDESAQRNPITLGKKDLLELSRITPLRSSIHIIVEWGLIVATIYLCERRGSLALYLAAIVWIATRQHALMILLHEGTHYRLFRNRKVNDWISELVLAWPVLISARSYRRNHFAHHRYLNTERDPDWVRRNGDPAWVFPKRPIELATLLLSDLTGFGAIVLVRLLKTVASRDESAPPGFLAAKYSFYLIVAVAAVWTHTLKAVLLFWFVPLFTCLVFIFRIRSIAEHSALTGTGSILAQTRTTFPSLLERVLFAPKNVNYHLEHHLFPSVPFYRLPKLHTLLSRNPNFSDAHLTDTYVGVLRECVAGSEHAANPELWREAPEV
jgi:fatty acid desaturase